MALIGMNNVLIYGNDLETNSMHKQTKRSTAKLTECEAAGSLGAQTQLDPGPSPILPG